MILPKVSVVIPCHNSEKTLPKCLNSALNQSYENYEVLVIDNNSSDKTREIIKKFEKKDKKIKYFFEPRVSTGAARKKGELNARGKIVLMTDSDCILPKNWIEKISEPIRKGKAVAVQGPKIAAVRNYWSIEFEKEEKKNNQLRVVDGKIGLLDTANFAIKKNVLKKIGYSNPVFSRVNDTELEARVRSANISIVFVTQPVFHNYPLGPIKLFKKNVKSGYGYAKVKKIHKIPEFFIQENNLDFFVGLLGQAVFLNKSFFYNFVKGVAWRLGGLLNSFKKKDIKNS